MWVYQELCYHTHRLNQIVCSVCYGFFLNLVPSKVTAAGKYPGHPVIGCSSLVIEADWGFWSGCSALWGSRSWVSDYEEERQRKKNRGDSAELMCDRKSSRRHAGKRESSSRSSESGSRSADGAAPEIPIVIPDGKEFWWPAGRCNDCWDIIAHISDRFLLVWLSMYMEVEAE